MNMDVENNKRSNNLLVHREEFETVYGIITTHTNRVMSAMHNESLNMLWEVGAYVSNRINHASWGDGVVRMLAEYIHTRNPKAKGWSYRTIYKMVQFYEAYSTDGFRELVNHYGMQHYLSDVVSKDASAGENAIVPIGLAQIPSVLFATGWSNHQLIKTRFKRYWSH